MREWLQPSHYERRYSRFLENSITEAKREFYARLQALPEWDSDSIDIASEEFDRWWTAKREEKRRNFYGYFAIINAFNDKQFIAVVKSGTGLTLPSPGQLSSPYSDLLKRFGDDADVIRNEEFLDEVQKSWVSVQDTNLNKAVTGVAADASVIVKQGIASTVARKIIEAALDNKFDKTGASVGRSGKDQVSKLNTQLEKKRLTSLNLDEYEWITRRDERVRGNPSGLYPNAKPSHFAREGQIFRWAEPPEGGHPGEADGCRCKARVFFRK